MTVKKKTGGLAGVVAGETAIATVGKEGKGLNYRGYSIHDLAAEATFEEVAFLLLYGHLPLRKELDSFTAKLVNGRQLPESLCQTLRAIPADAHPMDVLRTGCSMLGVLEPETTFDQQEEKAERLLACLPSMLVYWYRFAQDGTEIDFDSSESSIAGYFLEKMHDATPSDLHRRVMDVSLVLYAEHEFNASTFTARVCASTLSDMHSCVTGAIGSLRGPLHGGANEAAMDMIQGWLSPDEAETSIMAMLARKDKIMGFGHAIYRESDPRNVIIKSWSKKLAEAMGDNHLYPVSVRCEEVMWREKKLFCNADFFHASTYNFMGIPTKLFTPIFVMSRLTGWAAHVMEQRTNNRIIRPSADYTGPETAQWVDIENRG